MGWYYGSTLIESGVYDDYDTSITLVAQWEIIGYTIDYDTAGGELNGQITHYDVNTDTFTLPIPTKTGYTFIGWSGTGIVGVQLNVSVEKGSVGNRSYIANWVANTYIITFDANGGACSSPTQEVTYNSTYTLPTPTRTGYTFEGWFVGSEQYTSGTWETNSDVTLVAKWTINYCN